MAAHAQQKAVLQYFAGNQALFDAFWASCMAQLPVDLVKGDTACAAADWTSLRRTAHDLKSVLLMLGYPQLSDAALQCEEFSHQGQADKAVGSWRHLHTGIMANFHW